MMAHWSFRYGDQQFEYEVVFTSVLRQKIAIHVHPDASIQVEAPEGEDLGKVHSGVVKRARWIKKHVDAANRQRAYVLPRRYVSGESHFYLGRRYQLKVSNDNVAGPCVRLRRGHICVDTPAKNAQTVKKKLTGWYRGRAKDVFGRRLAEVAGRLRWLKDVPQWQIISMRKQWGSCSAAGVILLNPHLVKAPRDCVDYVICHELCHLQEHNHSPRYYRLLSQAMPGWESVKIRLDGMAELLLNE